MRKSFFTGCLLPKDVNNGNEVEYLTSRNENTGSFSIKEESQSRENERERSPQNIARGGIYGFSLNVYCLWHPP